MALTPTRLSWSHFSGVIDHLDGLEIEQFAQYDGTCSMCGEPFYGILDESRLTFPMGNLRSVRECTYYIPTTGQRVRGLRNVYEVRQEVVRSGVFSRTQLRGALFTQHELGVNDRAFLSIRPRRCGCDFGPWQDLDADSRSALLACGYVPPETEVETAFVGGSPVRTGFRLRSREAIARRRSRSRGVEVKVHGPESSSDEKVRLKFHYRVPKHKGPRASKKKSHRRGGRPTAKQSYTPVFRDGFLPFSHERKYWYFTRTRGRFYRSQHRPI
jgi:hypothetical protein